MKKKLWSIVLCFVMVFALIPTTAFAEVGDGQYITGACGPDANYILDRDNGELQILGTGDVTAHPWTEDGYDGIITSLFIGKGITNVNVGYQNNGTTENDWGDINDLPALQNIEVEEGSETFSALNGVLFNADQTMLLVYPAGRTSGYYSIPETVKSVGGEISNGNGTAWYSPFRYGRSIRLIVPASVTEIQNIPYLNVSYYTVSEGNSVYSAVDGILYSKDISVLYRYPENVAFETFQVPESVKQIECRAFSKNANLRSVEISAVDQLMGEAFEECINLQHVVFGDSATIESIPYGTFVGCSSLQTVVLPDTVESIGNYAFVNCQLLQSIVLPNQLRSIGDIAFADCTSLEELFIPARVANIGDSAFSGMSGLQRVEFESGSQAASIPQCAFFHCTSLTQITLPGNLISIGDEAFENCRSLQSIVIPSTVTSMGRSVFYNCSSLTSVNIPAGLETLSDMVFENCSKLETVTMDENSSLTRIGNSSFRGCSALTEITLPETLKSIGGDGFLGCRSLQSIVIPAALTSFGGFVFKNCTSLQSVSFGIGSELRRIEQHMFEGCTNLQIVILPDGITTIGNNAFHNCHNLQSVQIPAAVRTIEYSAFEGCNQLNSLTFGSCYNLTTIGSFAFAECPIQSITLPLSLKSIGRNAFTSNRVSEITIPAQVCTLGREAFSHSGYLRKVTFADGSNVTVIPDEAFCWCWNLQEVEFPSNLQQIGSRAFGYSGLEELNIPDSVSSVGKSAFYGNWDLTTVSFGSGSNLRLLSSETFKNCSALTSVTLPEALEEIETGAFQNCTSLRYVIIPNKVNEIGRRAFKGCSELINTNIPDGVTEIANETFAQSGLTFVDGMINVRTIGYAAFDRCTNLEEMDLSGTKVETIGNSAFYHCDKLPAITIPASVLNLRPSAFEESGLESVLIEEPQIVTGEEGRLTEIPEKCFNNCNKLSSVTIPTTIERVNGRAFEGTSALKEIDLPDHLWYLGPRAFYGSGIKYIEIPDEMAERNRDIRPETFKNSDLESLSVPGGVRRVGYSAFENCTNLKTIDLRDYTNQWNETMENGFTFVADKAFRNCLQLENTGLNQENITTFYIGNAAYKNCKSLTGELKLPIFYCGRWWGDGLILGRYAFAGCSGISSVDLTPVFEEGVTEDPYGERACSIANGVFKDCTSLTSVTLPSEITQIGSHTFEGCSALSTVNLPEKLTELGDSAFRNSGIKTISIPETLPQIAPGTFMGSKLEKAELPETVRSIGYSAFEDCSNLNSIDISHVNAIEKKAFLGCNALKAVTIGSAEWLPSLQIYSYLEEQALDIPNLRATFEGALPEMNNPFHATAKIRVKCSECSSMTPLLSYDVFLQHSFVNDICEHCGSKLDELESVGGNADLVKYPIDKTKNQYLIFNKETGDIEGLLDFDGQITEVAVPESIDGVEVIGIAGNAFSNDTLEKVTLPSGIQKIEGTAFNGSRIAELTLPVSAGFTAGFDLDTLTRFVFTAGKSEAQEYDDSTCKQTPWYINRNKVMSIQMTEGISRIGDYAFANQKVERYEIPSSVKEIGNNAFYRNSRLKAVDLKEGLEKIGYAAFAECELLESITLPTTLTNMKYNSFAGDENLVATVYADTYGVTAAKKYGVMYQISESGPIVTPPEQGEEIGQVQLSVGYSKPGATVEIPVYLTNNPGITMLTLGMEFDRESLELIDVINGSIFGDSSLTVDRDNLGTAEKLLWSNSTNKTNIEDTGKLVLLKFKVKDTTAEGDYTIRLTCSETSGAYDAAGKNVKFSISDGAVTVQDFLYGDMNADGVVNILDAPYLKYYIASFTGYEDLDSRPGDVDKDGKVTARDLMILERFLAAWKGYEYLPVTGELVVES